MGRCIGLLLLLLLLFSFRGTAGKSVPETGGNNGTKTDGEKYNDLTEQLEKYFKSTVRSVMKSLFPYMMSLREDSEISGRCMQSLTKYVMGLSKAKMWAVQMLDATSKIPSGLLIGTFADFGSFDECLDVRVFHKNGDLDFQGSSCSVEMRPPMPPLKRRISLAEIRVADPEDTLGAQFREAYQALHHKHLKFIVCVPSTCSLGDVRHIAERIANETDFRIRIPECYVEKGLEFLPVHIAVITALAVLLILGITGSVFESWKGNSAVKKLSTGEKILTSFSLSSNFKRFISVPGGSTELKCIHGVRAMSICWVILGHSYVYMDFEILKDPIHIQTWFGTLAFEFIHNGWIAVESFFLLSGILVAYSGLKTMDKTGGKLNLPLLILRRYLRLTPSVLLLMGLVFFLPLLSSGPFWHEHVEPPLESCRKYWWTTLLYFSNWWGIDKGCIQTTWYLAADFQLHVLSLFILIALFRYAKVAVGGLFVAVVLSCAAVAVQTWVWDLGATAQLSTGDDDQVFEILNRIHIQTFTHLGPHCIGMAVGFYIFKFRERKLSKPTVVLGWCASVVLCLTTILGSHRFSAGKESSPFLTTSYAALHRCAYTFGIAWVLLACIAGYGGPVNKFLSSPMMAPISRLTYMIYLIHPLIVWTKLGSLRERVFASHYEFVYIYLSNVLVSIAVAVPFYLLLEAPLSNIERILTSRSNEDDENRQKESSENSDITLIKVKLHPPELNSSHLTSSEKSNS